MTNKLLAVIEVKNVEAVKLFDRYTNPPVSSARGGPDLAFCFFQVFFFPFLSFCFVFVCFLRCFDRYFGAISLKVPSAKACICLLMTMSLVTKIIPEITAQQLHLPRERTSFEVSSVYQNLNLILSANSGTVTESERARPVSLDCR